MGLCNISPRGQRPHFGVSWGTQDVARPQALFDEHSPLHFWGNGSVLCYVTLHLAL